MNQDFQNLAKKLKNSKLLETEEYFQENKVEFMNEFKRNFRNTCVDIVQLQKDKKLQTISYLEYTMLYSNFIKKQYIAEIRVYGADWYMNKHPMEVGRFDVSFLFVKCTELWEELLKIRKGYIGKVTSMEVTQFMIDSFSDFFSYIVITGRFAILECIEDDNFKAIDKADDFEINVGEYMAHTEAIFKENKNKNRKQLIEWFKQRLELDYAFEDLTGMDFSGEDFSEIDFRYSDLRHTNLANTDFQDSMLYGTRFCNADMQNADLRYSEIYEADFTGANLYNAKFISVEADAGIQSKEQWEIAGFMGVSFRNADLRYADFSKSSLLGADFTNAQMDGAVFDETYVDQLNLTPEQYNVIVIK